MTTIIKRNNWAIWRDVIFALFVREIRTSFNDKLGIAWAVISPVAFILAKKAVILHELKNIKEYYTDGLSHKIFFYFYCV